MRLGFGFAVPPFVAQSSGVINVLTLFAAGEQGAWYDPSDISTLFQDSAGTTQVTAPGQPVGLMQDKSGQGNHASQSTAGSRPVLQQDAGGRNYLEFDGVDDFLVTSSINFTATDKMTVVAGVRKTSDAAEAWVINLNSTAAGGFSIRAPGSAGVANYVLAGTGTGGTATLSPIGFAAPDLAVLSGSLDLAAPLISFRRNGTPSGQSSAATGGSFANAALHIGQRSTGSLRFNGRLYGLLVRGAQSSDAQIRSVEHLMAVRTGLTF